MLRRAVDRAKLGEGERLAAVRRLDEQARVIEGAAAVTEAEFERGVEREWAAKASLGGRTVADDARRRKLGGRAVSAPDLRPGQLSLSFGPSGESRS